MTRGRFGTNYDNAGGEEAINMVYQSEITRGAIELYDEAASLASSPPRFSGVRLPDGRTLSWTEYGSGHGVPCLLLPDARSSRLAPRWLLHGTDVPAVVRLLALDRPGVGASDQLGFGDQDDLADDLRHLVNTLGVGRIAAIGVGQGASDALTFATRYPAMLTTVLAVSPRISAEHHARRHPTWLSRWSTAAAPDGPVAAWLRAAGRNADLTAERTWERAIPRMDPQSARVLGDRWRDPDFRQALADDMSQADRSWTTSAAAPVQPDWEHTTCPVPVRIWHGRDETGTTLEHVQTIADRHGWQVSTVDDYSALLGAWTQILAAANASFQQALAWRNETARSRIGKRSALR